MRRAVAPTVTRARRAPTTSATASTSRDPSASEPSERHQRQGLVTDTGVIAVEVPRADGGFEPLLIGKHERPFTGFNAEIIALYAHVMTVLQLNAHLREMYAVEVADGPLSEVTDALLDRSHRVAEPFDPRAGRDHGRPFGWDPEPPAQMRADLDAYFAWPRLPERDLPRAARRAAQCQRVPHTQANAGSLGPAGKWGHGMIEVLLIAVIVIVLVETGAWLWIAAGVGLAAVLWLLVKCDRRAELRAACSVPDQISDDWNRPTRSSSPALTMTKSAPFSTPDYGWTPVASGYRGTPRPSSMQLVTPAPSQPRRKAAKRAAKGAGTAVIQAPSAPRRAEVKFGANRPRRNMKLQREDLSSALIIRPEPLAKLLAGRKPWEMRSNGTSKRGTIGQMERGSGMIVGVAD